MEGRSGAGLAVRMAERERERGREGEREREQEGAGKEKGGSRGDGEQGGAGDGVDVPEKQEGRAVQGAGEAQEWATMGRGLGQHQTVCAAELIGIHLALTSIPLLPNPRPLLPRRIVILCNNQAAVGSPCGGARLLGQFIHLANRRVYPDLQTMYRKTTVAFQWAPGHLDVEGNKLADVEAKAGAEAEEQVKELTESCRRAELEGWRAIAPNGCLAEAKETKETSEKREKGEGDVPISSKSCWGLEGLGKAATALQGAHKAVVSQDWASQ
jgi:hypothetical protein